MKKGDSLSPLRDGPGRSRSAVKGGCLIANAGLWYRFQDIQGYDPMILKRYVEYINRSQGFPPDNTVVNLHYVRDFNNRLIRMLNLKYVVLCETGKLGKTQPFIPRCRIVHRMTEKRRDEILDFMAGKEFDPMNMVIFEKDQAPGGFLPREPARQGGEMCEIIRYSNDEVELTAKLQTPGFLVMSEIYYPGWEVYVDGKRGKIYTGDYLFRTVPLEAGYHRVLFVFNPGSLKTGALISVLSLLVSVIVIFLASRGGRSTAV
ncbi:MAG: YfhO family protein [Deltaproteobacteria bacterium]|nr:YfhO family protein [Deltaproteobacteria bacterium]